MTFLHIVGIVYLFWNVLTFILVGIDKLKSKMAWYRISELALLLCTFFLGAIGVSTGMIAFRHKVSKAKFRWFVPIAVLLNLVAVAAFVYLQTTK